MPRKTIPPARQAANPPHPQMQAGDRAQPAYGPAKGPKGGKPKWGGTAAKRMPIPGKGWGR